MSRRGNKLISQDRRKDYGEEVAEGTKALSQSDNKFNGADDEFEEARAEENAFDAARTEYSEARPLRKGRGT